MDMQRRAHVAFGVRVARIPERIPIPCAHHSLAEPREAEPKRRLKAEAEKLRYALVEHGGILTAFARRLQWREARGGLRPNAG